MNSPNSFVFEGLNWRDDVSDIDWKWVVRKFDMLKFVCFNDFHFEQDFDCVCSWKLKFNMTFCYNAKFDPVRVSNVHSDWNCSRSEFEVTHIFILKHLSYFCKWKPLKLKFIDIKVFLFSTFINHMIFESSYCKYFSWMYRSNSLNNFTIVFSFYIYSIYSLNLFLFLQFYTPNNSRNCH